jgi:hypothetical protein
MRVGIVITPPPFQNAIAEMLGSIVCNHAFHYLTSPHLTLLIHLFRNSPIASLSFVPALSRQTLNAPSLVW